MDKYMYGIMLQFKMDIRSKSMLITSYIVPLLFFVLMGSIFTSVDPTNRTTLIQSMTIMGVAMGSLVGLPQTIAETYGKDVKRAYKANSIPLWLGLLSMLVSTFTHLMIMSSIIFITAIFMFDASVPSNLLNYFIALIIYVITSLSIGCIIGLSGKKEATLTMISQIIFLPSIMLSGILFSASFLPKALGVVGKIFPTSWAYQIMMDNSLSLIGILPLIVVFIVSMLIIALLMKKSS